MIAPGPVYRSRRSQAFTLLELVLALTVTTVLVGALGSSILIASQAIPAGDSPADQKIDTARLAQRMGDDLNACLAVLEANANRLTLVTSDQTGDGRVDRVTYAHTASGDAVTRQINDLTAETIIKEAVDLTLSYTWSQDQSSHPGGITWGSEVLLDAFEDAEGEGKHGNIEDDQWRGQIIDYTAPDDALSLDITRVEFLADPRDDGGTTTFRLYAADGGDLPTGSVINETLIDTDSWPSGPAFSGTDNPGTDYWWTEIPFDGIESLTPGERYLVAAENHLADPDKPSRIRMSNDVGGYGGSIFSSSGDPGWEQTVNDHLVYRAYGRFASPGGDQLIRRQRLDAVNLALTLNDTNFAFDVRPFNRPQSMTRYWRTDLTASPLLIDLNGDGAGDWLSNGTVTGRLVDGAWDIDGELIADAQSALLDDLITLKIRTQPTSTAGSGVQMLMTFDFDGSDFGAKIRADLSKESDGTYTLELLNYTAPSTSRSALTKTNLRGEMTDLRFVLNPDAEAVAIWVDGIEVGAFSYTRFAQTGVQRGLTISTPGSNGQLDHVEIRVGGEGL